MSAVSVRGHAVRSVSIGGLLRKIACACSLVGIACGAVGGTTYTLYRNSPTDRNLRIHVATFDADETDSYNRENCEIAQGLFQEQSGVNAKYWCEKGSYRK